MAMISVDTIFVCHYSDDGQCLHGIHMSGIILNALYYQLIESSQIPSKVLVTRKPRLRETSVLASEKAELIF